MTVAVLAERVLQRAPVGTIIRARAPLRISFAGGGTDFPHYYERHGGAALSCTINRFASVTVYPRDDREITIRSLDLGRAVHYSTDRGPIFDGVLDLAKATIQRVGVGNGMDLYLRTDAPAGGGLGGSSALTAAMIGALDALAGPKLDRTEMAELSCTIERQDLQIPGGKQDQFATTFGGLNWMEFSRQGVTVDRLDIAPDVLCDLEAHLLLCYTGQVRTDLGLIHRQIARYCAGEEEAIRGTRDLHRMAYRMRNVLVDGQLDAFGTLLHEAYMDKLRINPHIVEGTAADELYDTARRNGALGGKLSGAGGGGYLLLYCRTDRQLDVRRALELRGGQLMDFALDDSGLQVWRSDCP